MRKFRHLFAIVATALCCISLSSCDLVDDNYEIYGTWEYSYKEYVDGYFGNIYEYEYYKELTFNRNDECYVIDELYIDGKLDDWYESSAYYLYDYWDDYLSIEYPDGSQWNTNCSINGDKMTLTYYMNGGYYTEIYWRRY